MIGVIIQINSCTKTKEGVSSFLAATRLPTLCYSCHIIRYRTACVFDKNNHKCKIKVLFVFLKPHFLSTNLHKKKLRYSVPGWWDAWKTQSKINYAKLLLPPSCSSGVPVAFSGREISFLKHCRSENHFKSASSSTWTLIRQQQEVKGCVLKAELLSRSDLAHAPSLQLQPGD